jgi:serine/threonine protein kinase
VNADAPLIGAVVDGKYQVQSLLGRGGMGAVYRAVHTGTDRTVALKVIAGSFAGDEEYVERFRREARACGRLRHPGIVDVTDFGVAGHGGRPLPYLVMEFLDGRTLADALREQPSPPLPWVIEVLEQVCSAVEEAHRHGILHRDLKPENVWLEPDRRGGVFVKVLDFGLAKLDSGEQDAGAVAAVAAPRAPVAVADDISATFASGTIAPALSGAEGQTMAGSSGSPTTTGIAGTPAYMSPEQSLGEPATARSDVYSIGVIAYRMITGRLPFEGSLDEVLTAKRETEPAPLLSIRPDVHADAANLVSLAMARDPARRPASAGVFGNMLAAQLEPAGAFFTRAFVLSVSRLSTFLKVAALASAPLLAVAVLGAAWQLAARAGGVPALSGRAALTFMGVVFVLGIATQILLGVLPLFVLHALHAPSRPIEVLNLVRAYGPRMRFWLSALLPVLIGTVSVLAMAGVAILLIRYFAPVLRTWPRPLRLVPLLIGVTLPFVLGYMALKRKGLGVRELGLLGAVLLVEDVPFAAAVKRSAELMVESGGLRNAVQKWYNGVVVMASLLVGIAMGASGAAGNNTATFVLISPLLAAALTLFLLVNGIVAALIYVSARRSKGESLERIYSDLVIGQASGPSGTQASKIEKRSHL